MPRSSPLPPYLHGAAFRTADREFHLLSASRLRGADLQRPFHGVRATGFDLADALDRCRAYLPRLRPGEAFSHQTAATLFGLPLPRKLQGAAVHVTAPPGLERARARGVVGHESASPVPIVLVHGLPVVDPAVAWCQLAMLLRPADLIAMGDALVTGPRRRRVRAVGLVTLDDLATAVRRWGRRRGARRLAAALPRVRVGAESPAETELRLLLVDHGFPEPIPNDPTELAHGEVLHPDLKLRGWRTVLEYQGDRHRVDRRRWQEDIRRKRAFATAGWHVVEVTADDLYVDATSLLARLRALAPPGWRRAVANDG